jgi:hypothetical protein
MSRLFIHKYLGFVKHDYLFVVNYETELLLIELFVSSEILPYMLGRRHPKCMGQSVVEYEQYYLSVQKLDAIPNVRVFARLPSTFHFSTKLWSLRKRRRLHLQLPFSTLLMTTSKHDTSHVPRNLKPGAPEFSHVSCFVTNST